MLIYLCSYLQELRLKSKPECFLTFASVRCFAIFASGRGVRPPGDSKRGVVELRGKDQQIVLAEYSRWVVLSFVLGQHLTPVMAGQRSNFRIIRINHMCMAGETGVDREGPSPPGSNNSISWVGPGGTQYIAKMGPFSSL